MLTRYLTELEYLSAYSRSSAARSLIAVLLIYSLLLPTLVITARVDDSSPEGSGFVALVKHAPIINGRLEGSLRQLAAESVVITNGGIITGALQVPGRPAVVLNGSSALAGAVEGTGNPLPTNYSVTLNSGSSLGYLVNRTDPISI